MQVVRSHVAETGFHVCRPAGYAGAVHLRFSAMDFIAETVRAAYESVRKRGVETGGLLLGGRAVLDDAPAVIVESAEIIECEHKLGPSFVLSDRDREKLADQLARLRAEGLVVVGFYRSHTRDASLPGVTLSDEDRALFDSFGAPAANLFLLVRPVSLARLEAKILVRDAGQFTEDGSLSPFPFGLDTRPGSELKAPVTRGTSRRPGPLSRETEPMLAPAAEMQPRRRERASAKALAEPAQHSVEPAERSAEPSPEPVSAPLHRSWAWMAMFALLGGFFGYEIVSHVIASRWAAQAGSANMDLAAIRSGGDLIVHWNPALPEFAAARRADLLVGDGPHTSSFDLNRAQLQEGSFTYTPQSEGITLMLETYDASGRVKRESLVFLDSGLAGAAGIE